jgi:acetaldehyde dehydrogenase/alcohol dehydrogenase
VSKAIATSLGITDDVRVAVDGQVERARVAADAFRALDQAAVDRIVEAMVRAGLRATAELARLAVQESGFGVFEDKVIKNFVATEFLNDYLKNKKSVGVIDSDPANGLEYIAEPIGVIVAVTPITNPTSTILFKAICAAKTRNAILFRPHPLATRCAVRVVEILTAAGEAAGLPAGAIQVVPMPENEVTHYLFKHSAVDFLWTTGGPGIVRLTNEAGKPCLSVGPGNAPCYVHRSADIKGLVVDVLISKTFDASVICPAEQTIIVDHQVYDEVVAEFVKMGAHLLSEQEARQLADFVFEGGGDKVNMKALGQKAPELARRAGIEVPRGVKVLLAELPADLESLTTHKLRQEKLMPVLGLVRARDVQHAIDCAVVVTEHGGLGHTSSVYARDEEVIRRYSAAVRTGRILVNAPTAVGALGGVYNSLPPTFSLGCGTWGGSMTTDNVNYKNLLNIKTVSRRKTPPQWFRVPADIYFKTGSLVALDEQSFERVLIVTDHVLEAGGVVAQVRSHLGTAHVKTFDNILPEPDIGTVMAGVALVREFEPDVLVAIGGGSVLDASKAMRLFFEHPELTLDDLTLPFLDPRKRVAQYPQDQHLLGLIAIPTTAGSGSEVSPGVVLTHEGRKVTLIDYCLLPDQAIVDPTLMLSLPPNSTADTGLDALTHALEGAVSIFSSPYTDAFCVQAVSMIFEWLPRAFRDGEDLEARTGMADAATLAGLAFSNAFLGVNHALAHAIGVKFHIAHGRANALLLPHVLRYNSALPSKFMPAPGYSSYVAPDKYARIGRIIFGGHDDEERRQRLFDAVEGLIDELGMPRSMKDAGVLEADFLAAIPELVDIAFHDVCLRTNPRMPLLGELEELLRAAYYGTPMVTSPELEVTSQ